MNKPELQVVAIGGYLANGYPYIAWPVSFDGGETWCRPTSSLQLSESMPQVELWRGTYSEYEALRDGGYQGIEWPVPAECAEMN